MTTEYFLVNTSKDKAGKKACKGHSMTDLTRVLTGLSLPFLGTTIGSAAVFIFKKQISAFWQRLLPGFASGVMIAASVWSLLLPAISIAEQSGIPPWLPAVGGFAAGVVFLLLLDRLMPRIRQKGLVKGALGKSFMTVLAVTLHNLPEGMAVGVVFAGLIGGDPTISYAGAMALSLGIAVQNFPEGAIISAPLAANGMKKSRAFIYGVLSGAVEPIGALLTMAMTALMTPILPYILSFAAGAMIYVTVEELIPESQSGGESSVGTIGAAIGFALMMLLDVAFG